VEFSLSNGSVGAIPIVAVRGEVDVESAPALRNALGDVLATDVPAVVVDLSEVAFLDSTGLGALVAARSTVAESDRRMAVVCDSDRIIKLFRITGLDTVFEIYPSTEAAAQALNS
jgi:anti-sigma B factor antagonist